MEILPGVAKHSGRTQHWVLCESRLGRVVRAGGIRSEGSGAEKVSRLGRARKRHRFDDL